MIVQVHPSWADDVFDFWFSELGPGEWFSARPEVDLLVSERFGALHSTLADRPPAPQELDARDHVSAVILFDQFSRHLFRQSPEAFATDPLALAYATDAVERRLDEQLGLQPRQFLYMPFMHSESKEVQARSIELFRNLGQPELLGFAQQHQVIIDRFGRFPHRNAMLNRVSTAQETKFLRTWSGFA